MQSYCPRCCSNTMDCTNFSKIISQGTQEKFDQAITCNFSTNPRVNTTTNHTEPINRNNKFFNSQYIVFDTARYLSLIGKGDLSKSVQYQANYDVIFQTTSPSFYLELNNVQGAHAHSLYVTPDNSCFTAFSVFLSCLLTKDNQLFAKYVA